MAPMQFAFVWPLKLRLCMGLFFCTFAQFPALFQSQFVLLSIFLIIHGDLRAFRKHMARLQTTKVATGDRQPPFHSFLHLHTCAFSLISSACFLWQVTAFVRRREGQAAAPRADGDTQNPRQFTVYCLFFRPLLCMWTVALPASKKLARQPASFLLAAVPLAENRGSFAGGKPTCFPLAFR